MLKRKIVKHRLILLAILVFTLSISITPIMFSKADVTPGVVENDIPEGCQMIDFEEGADAEVILSTIEGLQFTTTEGYDWIYGDVRRDPPYNAYSLTEDVGPGPYVLNGYFFAWLGEEMGYGRIDFTMGTASYFSVLTSTYSGLIIDAYDGINPDPIATSEWAEGNLDTYKFTRLTIEQEGMAYVIIHDWGNYWLIDDLVTDAPGVGAIPATIDFNPDTLNPRSKGQMVTVYIELPEEYDVNDVNISTVQLTYGGGTVNAKDKPTDIGDHDEDGIPDLMVKFDRSAVIAILEPGENIEIAVSGESYAMEDGFAFYGIDEIRVLDFY